MNSKNSVSFVFLALIIFIAIYVNFNIMNIYSGIGDFYYRHNNIQKSQEYYEKAFELGLSDGDIRDKYVNSILLNQLDITMQKKLIKFLEYSVNDDAEQKVKYFLYSLKEEINNKYPDNYIMQAPFNQKIVRWSSNTIKYGFSVAEDVPQYYIPECENAFAKWNKLMNYEIHFERDDNSPNIIINFIPYNDVYDENYKYVVAYTLPEIKANRLEKAKIDFYITDPKGSYFSENKVYNVALHEILHALGIYGHSYDKDDVMSLDRVEDAEREDCKVEPSVADINTLKLLYKIQPDITNTKRTSGEYISAIILGNEDDMITAKKIEAKNYVLQAPNLPSGYVDLAASYLDRKDYLNAVKNLERALDRAQTNDMKSIVYYNLGLTYYNMSHYTMAEDYLKKAQNLHDTEDIRALLGQVYADSNNLDKAIKIYRQLFDENPANEEYAVSLTNIYIKKKNYWKARECLKVYFTNCPDEKNNVRFNSYGILKLFL